MSLGRTKRAARRRASRRGTGPPAGAEELSAASTTRLSLYLRALSRREAEGRLMVSSEDLARAVGVKSALVRKDLTRFGQFGIRGVGYEVRNLRTRITRIMGLDRDHGVIVLGAGNLGMALADSRGFNSGGFKTLALFDSDRRKIGGQSRKGLPVRHMRDLARFARRHHVEVAVLAVPMEAAQKVLDQVARAGVRAVLNFVPVVLRCPRGLHLRSVDLKMHLEGLSCRLTGRISRPAARAGAGR